MAVPNTFATATSAIPLANLDANFSYYDTAYSISGTTVTYNGIIAIAALTASTALALNASKQIVSVTNTGTGNNVLATSPTLVTPILGTPTSGNFSTGTFTWPTFNQNTTGTAANVTGVVAVANGGTGLSTTPANGALDIGNGTGFTRATLTAGTGITITNAAGSITLAANNAGAVTSVTGTSPVASTGGATPAISLAASYGDTQNPYASKTANYVLAAPNGAAGVPTFRAIVATDIPTLNQNTTGTASNVTGTVALGNGGSGQTTAQAAMNAFAAAVTSGSYLRGNGTNVVMSTIQAADVPTLNQNTTGTASNVTGTVAIGNGGSGATTAQTAMNAFAGAVTSGSYLRGNGTNVVMATIQAADVPTLNQNTTGTAANVTGTVAVANGGSGATTLTGVLKGNGTSAFTAATAGTDYVAPGTATTFTALQTFSGTASNADMKTSSILEADTISATAATGTINYDVTTQCVQYYTSNATGNWTVNFRGSVGTTLNTIMATGECMSATFLVTNGATAYYNSAVTVDGVSVTPKWQGGSAPTSGNVNSTDCYTYVIQKTAASTYVVLASLTKFA